jgi:hypothetical protein
MLLPPICVPTPVLPLRWIEAHAVIQSVYIHFVDGIQKPTMRFAILEEEIGRSSARAKVASTLAPPVDKTCL